MNAFGGGYVGVKDKYDWLSGMFDGVVGLNESLPILHAFCALLMSE